MPQKNKKRVAKTMRKKRPARKRAITLNKTVGDHYAINNSFEFLYELRDLVLKSSLAEKYAMIDRINKLGRIKLAVSSGVLMNKENPDPGIVDLLIVGEDIENRRLKPFLKSLEAEIGKEVKFSVMEKDEFQYRYAMFDRFIRVLFEGPHEKLINKLGL